MQESLSPSSHLVDEQRPLIDVDHVCKSYRVYERPADRLKQALWRGQRCYFRDFPVLNNVSFQVRRGEVVGIIGRNGSGKSTLLQILAGTLTPSSGRADLNGRAAALLELGAGFNPDFTGRENIYLNAQLLGLTRNEVEAKLDTIIAFAGIGDYIDQPVRTYSSGMFVRLAFSIATQVDAEILIIDEALSVGDTAFQFKCMQRLEDLLRSGVTILLVTHDMQLVKTFCQRVVYLNKGEVRFSGDCETGTEMYLMDMRAEMQAAAAAPLSVGLKHALREGGLSFGTEQAAITAVTLACGDVERDHFHVGERATVLVEGWIGSAVESPRLVMVVRDIRGYNLFGFDNIKAGERFRPGPDGRFRARFSFDVRLQAGKYSLTLRLDDYRSNAVNLVLDKHVNACQFTVLSEGNRFEGVVDLDGGFVDESGASAASVTAPETPA